MELHDLPRNRITIRGECLYQTVERSLKLRMKDAKGLLKSDDTGAGFEYDSIACEEGIKVLLIILAHHRVYRREHLAGRRQMQDVDDISLLGVCHCDKLMSPFLVVCSIRKVGSPCSTCVAVQIKSPGDAKAG